MYFGSSENPISLKSRTVDAIIFINPIIFVVGLCISLGLYFRKIKTIIYTPEEQRQKEKEEAYKSSWYRLYKRYPTGLFCAFIIYCCLFNGGFKGKPTDWPNWLILSSFALCGCVCMWELTLVIILCGVVYLIYYGIAQLPTSVAIVIGAIIIALAIWLKKKQSCQKLKS